MPANSKADPNAVETIVSSRIDRVQALLTHLDQQADKKSISRQKRRKIIAVSDSIKTYFYPAKLLRDGYYRGAMAAIGPFSRSFSEVQFRSWLDAVLVDLQNLPNTG